MFSLQTSFSAPTPPPTPPPSITSDVDVPERRGQPALPIGYWPHAFPLVAGEALERLRKLERDFAESKFKNSFEYCSYNITIYTRFF